MNWRTSCSGPMCPHLVYFASKCYNGADSSLSSLVHFLFNYASTQKPHNCAVIFKYTYTYDENIRIDSDIEMITAIRIMITQNHHRIRRSYFFPYLGSLHMDFQYLALQKHCMGESRCKPLFGRARHSCISWS